MPKRYSPEIRRTALEFVNQGQTQIEVAQALGVNPKTLSHWVTTAQARMPEQQRNELEDSNDCVCRFASNRPKSTS